jgi:hypothetical protein
LYNVDRYNSVIEVHTVALHTTLAWRCDSSTMCLGTIVYIIYIVSTRISMSIGKISFKIGRLHKSQRVQLLPTQKTNVRIQQTSFASDIWQNFPGRCEFVRKFFVLQFYNGGNSNYKGRLPVFKIVHAITTTVNYLLMKWVT